MAARGASIVRMSILVALFRLILPLVLLGAFVAPAHAKPTREEEIQARIDAELEAMARQQEAAQPETDAPAAPPVEEPAVPARIYRTVPVILTTSLGDITIALEVERAPLTAANFLRYVDEKRLDGTAFYRSFTYEGGSATGFIQGGTQNDPKRILPPVPHEPTSQTGLSHTDGVISLAQAAPGTGNGDFFIIVGDMRGFDATADQPGFAAFGKVTAGMDVVRAILAASRSPTRGEGVMRGQMLEPEVRILSARRAPAS